MKVFWSNIKEFYLKNERHVTSGALLAGFLVDNFTLTRIDLWFDNIILFSYLLLSLLGIIILNTPWREGVQRKIFINAKHYAPLVVQFAFGGLFSGLVIFYTRSASFIASWPFLLILVGLLIGNEFLREKHFRFIFHFSIFFVGLFSFMIFYVPIIVNSIGVWVFVLSGVITLLLTGLIFHLFTYFFKESIIENKRKLTISVGSIFVLINILYFTNIIPPIPLSLKDIGVYHYVDRLENGKYILKQEENDWYENLFKVENVNLKKGENLFIFSSVFAPTDLKTDIIHSWQYYNEEKEEWVKSSKIKFPISGGRDGGYRGYSTKSALREGLWRVDVVSEDGRLIGRKKFEIKNTDFSSGLEVIYK